MNNFHQLLNLATRAGATALGFLFIILLANNTDAPAEAFRSLAIAQILSLCIPTGSLSHLFSTSSEKLRIWIRWSIGYAILGTILTAATEPAFSTIIATTTLAALMAMEKLCLANFLKQKKSDRFYIYLLAGRLFSIAIVTTLNISWQLKIVLCEASARALLAILPVLADEQDRPATGTPLISTVSSIFIAAATWLPLVAMHHATSSDEIIGTRVVILILYVLPTFLYMQQNVLESAKTKKYGTVSNKKQLALIFFSIATSIALGLYLSAGVATNNLTSNKTIHTLFSTISNNWPYITAATAAWLIAWNGAIIIARHEYRNEFKTSVVMLTAALCIWLLGLPAPVQALLSGAAWHAAVMFYYKTKEQK